MFRLFRKFSSVPPTPPGSGYNGPNFLRYLVIGGIAASFGVQMWFRHIEIKMSKIEIENISDTIKTGTIIRTRPKEEVKKQEEVVQVEEKRVLPSVDISRDELLDRQFRDQLRGKCIEAGIKAADYNKFYTELTNQTANLTFEELRLKLCEDPKAEKCILFDKFNTLLAELNNLDNYIFVLKDILGTNKLLDNGLSE